MESGPLAGSAHEITHTPWSIGRSADCDLVLDDHAVSTRHAEIGLRPEGYLLTDLDSHNGLWASGWRVRQLYLAPGMLLGIGGVSLQVVDLGETVEVELGPAGSLGKLVGRSLAMRRVFAQISAAAKGRASLLIEGESGTGKELVAETLHLLSMGEERPFEVFDCGAVTETLMESALFGHEEGAFTGATSRHLGALERANGGTLFLDEIGELKPELQVKLLRAAESGEFRRLGNSKELRSSVRIVAATNRDLSQLVQEGQFRADLFYRLSVLRIRVPPLRERIDDLPLLIEHFLKVSGASAERLAMAPDLGQMLQGYRWPGNVRELRNVVERFEVLPLNDALPTELQGTATDTPLDYAAARERAIEQFERSFTEQLLARSQGNVSRAAELAGISRRYVSRMMAKYGIKRDQFVG